MSENTGSDAVSDPTHQRFNSPLGGVMTREVGTISGELEAWIDPAKPDLVRVQYVGAEDVYTVKGKAGGRTLEEIVEHLTTDPGIGEDDNPMFTDLT